MIKKHTISILTILLSLCLFSDASGVSVTVTEDGNDLKADVSASFMFPGAIFIIPNNYTEFPVPPDACNIQVEDANPVSWVWSTNTYQTLYLPEQPTWPMIKWDLPYFPGPEFPYTISYDIGYEHKLVKRTGEFVFFYANESFEWQNYGYIGGMFSDNSFSVALPLGYSVNGVWTRQIPLSYSVSPGNVLTFSTSGLGNRIRVSIRPPCTYILEGDLNHDCIVDFVDFARVADNWLIDCIADPCNPSCVPE